MKCFCTVLAFFNLAVFTFAHPEPPRESYSIPPSGSYTPSGAINSYGPTSQYGPPQQPRIIHKHVYVHVPPPESEYQSPRKPIYVPPAQKHYKIVFIKAPSPPVPTSPVIPQLPQNEEKTLVYVLVKKPEEQPEIVIPTPVPTQPSKPEVYFIHYKTQKEATGTYTNNIAASPSGEYGAPSMQPSASSATSTSFGVPAH